MELVDYRKIDSVAVYYLEQGDLISVDNEIVEVLEVADIGNTYAIFYYDELLDEKTFIEHNDDSVIDLYMVE